MVAAVAMVVVAATEAAMEATLEAAMVVAMEEILVGRSTLLLALIKVGGGVRLPPRCFARYVPNAIDATFDDFFFLNLVLGQATVESV